MGNSSSHCWFSSFLHFLPYNNLEKAFRNRKISRGFSLKDSEISLQTWKDQGKMSLSNEKLTFCGFYSSYFTSSSNSVQSNLAPLEKAIISKFFVFFYAKKYKFWLVHPFWSTAPLNAAKFWFSKIEFPNVFRSVYIF